MPTPVVVVCDAAPSTGLGHFVRCTALAAALAGRDAEVRFLLPEDTVPTAVDRVHDAGWSAAVGSWDPSAVVTAAGPGALVVVDSYRVDGGWIDALADLVGRASGRLAVVDDAADRAFRADLVVNQNVGAERLRYPGAGLVLTGPRYALLRPRFPQLREQALAALDGLPDRPRTVLVLFGGTDSTGMAAIGARAALRAFPDARVRAVLPSGAPPGEPGIEWLHHVEDIAPEMLAADLVVSAGGTTVWELCCLARPAAVVAVAGNQLPTYQLLGAQGAILPVGDAPIHDVDELAGRLRRAVAPPGTLRTTGATAAGITDGLGAERVAAALLERRPPVADDGRTG